MKPVIDIHSHMLPGVDDGCKSREEALAMLRMYEEQGAEAVVCTPHFGPCGIPDADVDGAFMWLSSQPSSVKLYLGNEALAGAFDADNVDELNGPRMLAHKALLLEFDEWSGHHESTDNILKTLAYFDHFVCDVIIAHPERYRALQENPALYKDVARMAKLQINAYDIFDTDILETKITTRWLLANELVSYIGSDAHGAIRRPPALKNGVRWIYDHCDETYADAIVHDNAARLLNEPTARRFR